LASAFAGGNVNLDTFLHKRLLVVVAHQDDESLYFGGLLSSIVGRTEISLICTTSPMPGRADTDHRVANFHRVGERLQCRTVTCLQLPDCGPRGQSYPSGRLASRIAARLSEISDTYDMIITHNHLGEPNKVYGAFGHEAHKATHVGVAAGIRAPIAVCGRGLERISLEIDYDRARKMALLDCYAPWWTPREYDFCYQPETYALLGEAGPAKP
jgi:LmbE family N-acetylglucosaminyl deacetylase